MARVHGLPRRLYHERPRLHSHAQRQHQAQRRCTAHLRPQLAHGPVPPLPLVPRTFEEVDENCLRDQLETPEFPPWTRSRRKPRRQCALSRRGTGLGLCMAVLRLPYPPRQGLVRFLPSESPYSLLVVPGDGRCCHSSSSSSTRGTGAALTVAGLENGRAWFCDATFGQIQQAGGLHQRLAKGCINSPWTAPGPGAYSVSSLYSSLANAQPKCNNGSRTRSAARDSFLQPSATS